MSSPPWIKGLKELSKRGLATGEFEKLWAEMIADRNDRGAALIAGTLVENVLRRIVKRQMVVLNDTETDALFGRDAPLSTFSDLIRIGYAFGVFDVKIKKDLDRVREIRNAFAHAFIPVAFDTPEISQACMGFDLSAHGYMDLPNSMNIARKSYLTVAGRLIVTLRRVPERKTHEPISYEE